jgi:hypothetical protein
MKSRLASSASRIQDADRRQIRADYKASAAHTKRQHGTWAGDAKAIRAHRMLGASNLDRRALSEPLCPRFQPRSKEITMNRNFASILTVTTTAAAVLAVAAIASGNAYADDITIDTTPFVSTKTRAEVRAEVMGQPLTSAASEWAMQLNDVPQFNSGYTREQARAEYIAARDEVNARNAEDSGSSYFAALPRSTGPGVIMAGPAR